MADAERSGQKVRRLNALPLHQRATQLLSLRKTGTSPVATMNWQGLAAGRWVMNAVVLTNGSPSTSWRRAFAETLIRSRPDLNPDTADELSDSAYLRLADLDPSNAAAQYGRDGDAPAAHASDRTHRHLGP